MRSCTVTTIRRLALEYSAVSILKSSIVAPCFAHSIGSASRYFVTAPARTAEILAPVALPLRKSTLIDLLGLLLASPKTPFRRHRSSGRYRFQASPPRYGQLLEVFRSSYPEPTSGRDQRGDAFADSCVPEVAKTLRIQLNSPSSQSKASAQFFSL